MRRIHLLSAFCIALGAACGSSGPPIDAVYDLTRQSHFLAAPFPNDLLVGAQGTVDLAGFPVGEGLTVPIIRGYVRRFGTSVYGFGLNSAVYFKFSAPVSEGALTALNGRAPSVQDPVLLFPLGGSASDLVPVTVRFHESALGDPYLTDNVLTIVPRPGNPLRGGTAYAAVVLDSLRSAAGGPIRRAPAFDEIFSGRDTARATTLRSDQLRATLTALGIAPARVVTATVFTTQDVDGQLEAIRTRVQAALTDDHLELRDFKEVRRIAYTAGQTSNHGKTAAILTVTYTDDSTDVTELDPEESYPPALEIDTASYPYRVFEGKLRTLNLQGLAAKPYGTPGLGIINDASLDTGQIHFQKEAGGGLSVTSTPEPEEMRITICLPVDAQRKPLTGLPVLVFDHGTGGSAYTAVMSASGQNRSADLTAAWASHRAILVSRDQPLFGKRYPGAIDEGYNIFLIAYNIANITAFRDNLRQSCVDNLVLQRWVEQKMNAFFTAQGLATAPVADGRYFRFGHSLGSVTTNLGTAFLPGVYRSSLLSGSGGLLTLFFLDSGLLPRLAGDPENLGILLQALDIDPDTELTSSELIGALAGIPKGPARAQVDAAHPVVTLAQTLLDPADPINYARRLALPVTIVRGTGDYQVPNSATDALANALPNETVIQCDPTSDYDPHQCTFREDAGLAAVNAWLDAQLP